MQHITYWLKAIFSEDGKPDQQIMLDNFARREDAERAKAGLRIEIEEETWEENGEDE